MNPVRFLTGGRRMEEMSLNGGTGLAVRRKARWVPLSVERTLQSTAGKGWSSWKGEISSGNRSRTSNRESVERIHSGLQFPCDVILCNSTFSVAKKKLRKVRLWFGM